MRVYIHLYSQSQPIIAEEVINTYTKDGLFCVMFEDRDVDKYPLQHIFRISEEDYSEPQKEKWDHYQRLWNEHPYTWTDLKP